MSPKEITFSINDYDSDGYIVEKGVFLHFGNTRVKAADTVYAFCDIVGQMRKIIDEIDNNYPSNITDNE